MTVPTGTLWPVPLLAPWPGIPLGGAPLAGELRRGDLWGDLDEELDGVAGHLSCYLIISRVVVELNLWT